jgi:hypothetical protein
MLDLDLMKASILRILMSVIAADVEKVSGSNMVWTRDNTKHWVAQLENRIEDIEFYLRRTVEWCEENDVYSDNTVFVCSVMALTWVCHLRGEEISRRELFEILGIENWNAIEDAVLELNPKYEEMQLEELLELVVSSF